MSRRRFAIILIVWVAAIGLCSTELGALVGFMAGMAVAMFGGAVGVVLLQIASALGFEMSWSQAGAVLLYGTLGLICVFVVTTAKRAGGPFCLVGNPWPRGGTNGDLAVRPVYGESVAIELVDRQKRASAYPRATVQVDLFQHH